MLTTKDLMIRVKDFSPLSKAGAKDTNKEKLYHRGTQRSHGVHREEI